MSTVAQMLEDLILRVVKSRLPAAWQPHDVITVTSVGNGTVQGKKVGDPNPNNYPYPHEIAFTYDTPPRVGDRVIVRQSNQGTPHVSGILSTDAVSSPRFAVPPGSVNARTQYGADPTGATDSYSAIVNAAASLTSGGTIHLDPGTYMLSQPLVLDNNISLEGSGIDTLLTPGWSMTAGQYLISNGIGAGAPYYRDFQLGGNNAGNGLKVTADGARILNVDANSWLGYGMDVTSVGAYLQDIHTSVCGTAGLRLTSSTGARVIGGYFDSSSLVLHGTSGAEIVGVGTILGLTLEASSQNNHITECLVSGNVTVDNSSANTLLDCLLQGNLTEQNGAANNRYIHSPVTGTTTLLATSRVIGSGVAGTDPAFSVTTASGFTPDLINLNSGKFKVTSGGDVSHGFTPVTSARAVNAAALTAGATTTYSITGSFGVPSGARAVYAFVQTNTTTATGIIIGASGALPTSANYFTMASVFFGINMLIPLSAGGQIDVKPTANVGAFYLDVLGYVA